MMKYKTSRAFWSRYERLPAEVQAAADRQFQRWRINPAHPSLKWKKVGVQLWSVRITDDYRAVARRIRATDPFEWFWIGPHHEYDQLLRRRR